MLKQKGFLKNISIMVAIVMVLTIGYFTIDRTINSVQANPAGIVQTSTLNGVVVADNLVTVGSSVKEGQVLVMVKTFAGNAPASRAGIDGTVVEVLVTPGASISAGQVVATIKPN